LALEIRDGISNLRVRFIVWTDATLKARPGPAISRAKIP
jgi:hypothetical protein